MQPHVVVPEAIAVACSPMRSPATTASIAPSFIENVIALTLGFYYLDLALDVALGLALGS